MRTEYDEQPHFTDNALAEFGDGLYLPCNEFHIERLQNDQVKLYFARDGKRLLWMGPYTLSEGGEIGILGSENVRIQIEIKVHIHNGG